MSRRTNLSAAVLLACTVAAAPLAAQQDTSMMKHDTTMMDKGSMDHGSTDSSSMGQGSMDKGSMGHDSAMGMHKDMDMEKGPSMMFMGVAGQKAAGDYAITDAGGKQQLTLTDDFSVASGSDLYLVLANGETPDNSALWLGKLKHATGAQTYDLPKGKDLTTFTRLLVWSKKEKQAAASAEWHPVGGSMGHR
jgi:hypothetical protein